MSSDGAIYPDLLESFVRDELNRTATRCNITHIPIPTECMNIVR